MECQQGLPITALRGYYLPTSNPSGEIHFRAYTSTGTIAGITIDAVLRENHSYKNEVTKFPVQKGADVTDHIRVMPETVTITGVMTETPRSLAPVIRENNYGTDIPAEDTFEKNTDESRVLTSFEEFLNLAGYQKKAYANDYFLSEEGSGLMAITTSLRTYTNMALTAIDFDITETTGRSLPFTAVFQKVTLAKLTSTEGISGTTKGPQKDKVSLVKNNGTVTGDTEITKNPDNATRSNTVARNIFNK